MHPRVYAERNSAAQAKLVTSAKKLCEIFSLDDSYLAPLTITGRIEPTLRTLYQKEGVATILEAILVAVSQKPTRKKLSQTKPEQPEETTPEEPKLPEGD